MTTGTRLDASAARRLNALYQHVVETLPADALPPALTDALTGASGFRRGADGTTDLVATFTAIAQVHPEVRAALETLPAPKDVAPDRSSVDGALNSAAKSVVNLLTRSAAPRGAGNDGRTGIVRQLDVLSLALSEVQADRRFLAGARIFGVMDPINRRVSGGLARVGEKATRALEARPKTAEAAGAKRKATAYNLARGVASLGSSATAEETASALMRMSNAAPRLQTLRELMKDIIGQTPDSVKLDRMVSRRRNGRSPPCHSPATDPTMAG